MNRTLKMSIACLIFGYFLSGCVPKIHEGEVYKKDHQDEIIINNWIMIGDMLTPMPTIVPETYTITVKKEDEVNQKWLTASFEVDKDFYDSVEIGDFVCFDE